MIRSTLMPITNNHPFLPIRRILLSSLLGPSCYVARRIAMWRVDPNDQALAILLIFRHQRNLEASIWTLGSSASISFSNCLRLSPHKSSSKTTERCSKFGKTLRKQLNFEGISILGFLLSFPSILIFKCLQPGRLSGCSKWKGSFKRCSVTTSSTFLTSFVCQEFHLQEAREIVLSPVNEVPWVPILNKLI